MCTEYANKMRGYLTCMKVSGIITESGLRTLYLWYRSVRITSTLPVHA